MQTQAKIRLVNYISSILVFILGFFILYSETNQILNSFFIALLASFMVWATFIIMGWLAKMFIK
jgi:hypothetical protein